MDGAWSSRRPVPEHTHFRPKSAVIRRVIVRPGKDSLHVERNGKLTIMTSSTALFSNHPLLGTSKQVNTDELQLAEKINSLHQYIYSQGGLNSTNAAIEEISKLIFLRLAASKDPGPFQAQGIDVERLFAEPGLQDNIIQITKQAFSLSLSNSTLYTCHPDGSRDTLWPMDEPLRISNANVLTESLKLVEELAVTGRSVIDPLGTAFDAFLSGKYDHSGGLGTYLTPSAVARFMSDIALALLDFPLQLDKNVLIDPFCGTGRFLVAGFLAIQEKYALTGDAGNELLNAGIYGSDQSSSAVAKTGLNLMLYGATSPHAFVVDDSIGGGSLDSLSGTFPLILTNPPFGEGKYDTCDGIELTKKYFSTVSGAKVDPALGGLARCLELLQPNGLLGIVLPDGVLNGKHFLAAMNSGVFTVDACVSLPTATFALSGTVARTSAVFLRKQSNKEAAYLGRADHVGFIRKAGKAAPDPAGTDLPTIKLQIEQVAEERFSDVSILTTNPLVAAVPKAALTNVDPSRFDAEAYNARADVLGRGGTHLGTLISGGLKRRSGKHTPGETPFVSVLHVDHYGATDWVEASTYAPTTPGQKAYPGEVIISLLNPSKLRATVIPERFEYVHCSSEFGVLRGSPYPYAVLAMLYDPKVAAQLRPLGSGTSSSRRRVSIDDVLGLAIPSLSEDAMQELNERVKKSMLALDASREELARSYHYR